jgi:predicted amino acid dehydrogenase
MTLEVTGTAPEGTPAAQVSEDMTNVQITLEQITAAIVATQGTIEVAVSEVLKDYSGKSISITHDDEKNVLLFTLVDAPQQTTEAPAENA